MDAAPKKVIAWIKDDVDITAAVMRQVELAGHRIERQRTIGEALANLDPLRTCDLIVLDISVPVGTAPGEYGRYSGVDLLRELRTVHDVHTPVIVLSVLTDDHVLSEVRKLGVSEILRKPVLPSRLKEAVDRALGITQ